MAGFNKELQRALGDLANLPHVEPVLTAFQETTDLEQAVVISDWFGYRIVAPVRTSAGELVTAQLAGIDHGPIGQITQMRFFNNSVKEVVNYIESPKSRRPRNILPISTISHGYEAREIEAGFRTRLRFISEEKLENSKASREAKRASVIAVDHFVRLRDEHFKEKGEAQPIEYYKWGFVRSLAEAGLRILARQRAS